MRNRRTLWAANALTIFHLVAVLAFVFPGDPSYFRTRVLERIVNPYMFFTGAWQYWNLFAPEPAATLFELEVTADYSDGSRRSFRLPGPESVSFGHRYFIERRRKWRENLRQERWHAIFPDAARLMMREFEKSDSRAPSRITFIRHWHDIPPPEPGDYQPLGYLPLDQSATVYTYPELL